jgi:hypothetical protein
MQNTFFGAIYPDADLEERADGVDGELSTPTGRSADFGADLMEVKAASRIQRPYLLGYQGTQEVHQVRVSDR